MMTCKWNNTAKQLDRSASHGHGDYSCRWALYSLGHPLIICIEILVSIFIEIVICILCFHSCVPNIISCNFPAFHVPLFCHFNHFLFLCFLSFLCFHSFLPNGALPVSHRKKQCNVVYHRENNMQEDWRNMAFIYMYIHIYVSPFVIKEKNEWL